VAFVLKISINGKFSKALKNPKVVQDQNKHNNENQRKSLCREPCEYYYLGLYKKLNSLRHHVHYLTE